MATKNVKRSDVQTPVNAQALFSRINQAFEKRAKEGDGSFVLVKLCGRAADDLGEFVVVPTPSLADVIGHGPSGPLSRVEEQGVDLEEKGRELGVLRPWEYLARD